MSNANNAKINPQKVAAAMRVSYSLHFNFFTPNHTTQHFVLAWIGYGRKYGETFCNNSIKFT